VEDASPPPREAVTGKTLICWRGHLSRCDLDWVQPPVLNPYTRLAVTMSPARVILRVVGYEMTTAGLPEQVTEVCEI